MVLVAVHVARGEAVATVRLLVDVRYPGEFASSPLPGAINLPIRPTPTEQLKSRIAELPHRPIIAPCYDRRSCFFAEVLGLELDRAGLDFRGRYTVPSEYFIANTPRRTLRNGWSRHRRAGGIRRRKLSLVGFPGPPRIPACSPPSYCLPCCPAS